MKNTIDSLLTSLLLLVFVVASFPIGWILLALLNIAYDSGKYTFDLSMCGSLFDLYALCIGIALPLVIAVSVVCDLYHVWKGDAT